MSTYENYSRVADSYDRTRGPAGYEIWLGHLQTLAAPIETLHILDAGCGTGNYLLALAPHVGRITGLDANPEMLARAESKIEQRALTDRVELRSGSILEWDDANARYDAVMFNQVLHHLDSPAQAGFPGCERAIAGAAQSLKPGGVLLINCCSRRQLSGGFWYYHLAPQALEKVVAQQAPSADLRTFIASAGLSVVGRTVPLDAVLFEDGYLDAKGPLDASWRKGDSFWSLLDDAELADTLEQVQHLDAQGQLEEFVKTHDVGRRHFGQMTFWVAVKP